MTRGGLMENSSKKFSEKELSKVSVIVNAAATLFDKNGYLETSLKDISNEAKLSKGGIYHYFSNKHEILYFILDNYMDLLLGDLEEELKEIPDSPSKIQFIMFRHLKHYNGQVPEARALLNHAHNLPAEYFKVVSGKQKKYARILTDVLSGLFNGSMDLHKLKAISYIMFGMCNSIMYWYDPQGPVSLEELSQICYDIFMDGTTSYISRMGTVAVNSILA
jgi:TetR/AcrR family transcriptional regulator, cholesterol catabolism regulator